MSLEAMLTMIALWCSDTDLKLACQSQMSKCVQAEIKKGKEAFEPLFLRCWDKVMK